MNDDKLTKEVQDYFTNRTFSYGKMVRFILKRLQDDEDKIKVTHEEVEEKVSKL